MQNNLPNHVAVIMDGNGRWALSRGQKRYFGHEAGVSSLKKLVASSLNKKIKYLTVFAFSTENWKRPKLEIQALFKLLRFHIKSLGSDFHKRGIRVNTIGDLSELDNYLIEQINKITEKTKNNNKLILTIAINYGGRYDILQAVNKIVQNYKKNTYQFEITEEVFNNYLTTYNLPEPDLLIRTGGEKRISNFLLWQLAYSEIYFSDVLWPDFDENEFNDALNFYISRNRRFGAVVKEVENCVNS